MPMKSQGQTAQTRLFGRAAQALEDPKPARPAKHPTQDGATRPTVLALEDPAKRFQDAWGLVVDIKRAIQADLMDSMDLSKAALLTGDELRPQLRELVADLLAQRNIACNGAEQGELVDRLLADMMGLGPLEPLMADDGITDILVNGAHKVYVERGGRIERTDVTFADDDEVMNLAVRIATRAGRRIDEATPLVDARLADGSRVNIIVPPLAVDGPAISIRKFGRRALNLDAMVKTGSLSGPMAGLLMVAGASRLNILVSGGTGSGKTTLLNAISETIHPGERVVTIEDAAELRLMQPHVVRLETRPPSLEGKGEIRMRDLVRNALRMRPDRIILGEVRGDEVVDMLQAMNTGHEGSLGTIHANGPRHALTRLENLFAMAGLTLTTAAVRRQIADALDLIVHTDRMRDGVRRITSIVEVVGMEGDVILTQELFRFAHDEQDAADRVAGRFEASELRPRFFDKARQFGLHRELLAAMHGGAEPAAEAA
ncbi:MAG: TadA family conjugal transfer-associated ATPase [Alphaproteobacteria bacterium]|nr:TadA family conjugal transfer-associated ATPase [Alphaproteobacteria bacterium]